MAAGAGGGSVVGLDTGFFIALMKGDGGARDLWASLSEGDRLPVVSLLSLGELLYLAYRIGSPETGRELVEGIDRSARVMPVDRRVVEKAASLKAGRGIPYVDAMILATFMIAGCVEIHTTDRGHFADVPNQGLTFHFYG